jgi:Leucine-rich repeat (LRR) protein
VGAVVQLIEFPEINNDITEFSQLSLRYNYITSLPTEALYLSRLTHFYLDANPLKNAELTFSYSPILEQLSLFQTHLTHIPSQYAFRRLTKLTIGDNMIDLTELSSFIFPKLEYLDKSHCNLNTTELFLPITKMKSVKYLVLDNCKVESIPLEIKELKKLREISLIKNNISILPEQFYNLKLKLVNIENNPLIKGRTELLKNNLPKATIHF